jgi:hypothetical protein
MAVGDRVTDYHVLDVYSLIHFWWGTVYGWMLSPLSPLAPDVDLSWLEGFIVAVWIAITWELVENSQWCIDRCMAPIGFKYTRDSWGNMVGDVLSSSVGFAVVYACRDTYTDVLAASTAVMLVAALYAHCWYPSSRWQQERIEHAYNDSNNPLTRRHCTWCAPPPVRFDSRASYMDHA